MATINVTMPVLEDKYEQSVVMAPVVAAQSFVPGQLLALSGGEVEAVATGATSFFGVALGYAVDSMFGTANPPINESVRTIPVMRMKAGMTFFANLTGVLAQANLGAKYGVIVNANGVWEINQSDTTNLAVEIIELPPTPGLLHGGVGDTNARVKAMFIASAVA